MHILITGGSGYLGSVATPFLLSAGHQVTVIDNLYYGQSSLLGVVSHPKFNFIRGDARDERILAEVVPQVDFIIPLAAIVGAPACDREPTLAETLNLGSVQSLLKLRSPQQGIIFPTTNSGYGTTTGQMHCTEETPLDPISLYGRTKVQAEQELLEAGNVVTLRLATVFGVSSRMRLDLLVNDFTYEAVSRGYILIYEKHYKRNYVHIEDVADCFLFCLENFDKVKNEPYNFGLDEANYSKEELANLVKEQVPNFEIIFKEFGKDPDQRNYVVSNEKLRKRGFAARRSVQQGIRELIVAYQMLQVKSPFRNI